MTSLTNMTEENFVSYWDKLYSKKNYFGTGPTKLAKFAESLMKEYGIRKILEIGCGQGRDSFHFSELGYSVHAVDISEKAIDFVKNKKDFLGIKNITTLVHDIEQPLYYDEYFDFVYSNLALQFFSSERLGKIFSNISQVLKKNGLLLFSTKKEGDKYYNFGTRINDYSFEYKGIIRYFYSKETLSEVLSKKFDILNIDSDTHLNLDSTVSVWWKILAKKNDWFCNVINSRNVS